MVFVLSCASAGVKNIEYVEFEKTAVVNKDFNDVWGYVIEWAAINSFPIENFATPGEICLGETLDIELPLTENNVTYHLYDKNVSVESITSDGGSIVFENLIADIDSRYKILIDNCVDEVIAAEPKLEIHSTPNVDVINW